jgi:hypothetical protein
MASIDVGDFTFDAFVDVDFADEFLTGDVARSVAWAAKNDDAKGRGIVSATRMLLALPWCDTAPTFDDPPAVVKEVTAMLAADLLAKPKLFADASGNTNVKSVKAGSASVDFFSPVVGGPPLPRALWDMLLNADLVCLASGGSVNDGPFVSGAASGCRPLYGRQPWDWPVAAADYD